MFVSYISCSLRFSRNGVFLINLSVSLVALCTNYTASTYAVANTTVCQVFSLLFHFNVLVCSGAIVIMLFFMIYTLSKRLAFIAITANLSK